MLAPADTVYDARFAPDWLRDLLPTPAGARRIAIVATHGQAGSLDLSRLHGMAALNASFSVRELRALGFPYARRFAVLPSLANARWFVPLDSRRAGAAALRLFAPYRRSARAVSSAAAAGARLGLLGWRQDHVCLALREPPPLERLLAQLFPDRTLHLAFASGTPGPARKPAVAIIDDAGRALGVAKIAEGAAAARLVHHEAEVLRALASSPNGPAAPGLLCAEHVDGREVTIQSVLPGAPGKRSLSDGDRALLARLMHGAPKPAATSALFLNLRRRLAALPTMHSLGGAAIDRANVLLRDLAVPPTIVHGDFAPWNVRRCDSGLAAFDWEYAELDGLPELDAIHYELQVGIELDGLSADETVRRLTQLAMKPNPALTRAHLTGLQLVYLMDALLRCHEPIGWSSPVDYGEVLQGVLTGLECDGEA